MAGQERTEAPTPKRRKEAREKGQVARSMDANGAVVMLVGLVVLAITAPASFARMQGAMRDSFALMSTPSIVGPAGIGQLFKELGVAIGLTVGPIAFSAMVAGVAINVLQVRWQPSAKAMKPDPKRLNPVSGAKNLLGKRAWFELGKNLAKVAVVGAVVALAIVPDMDQLAALVGLPPAELLSQGAHTILTIGLRASAAYLVIAAADYGWQRHQHEKQLKMTKEEIKQEMKGQNLSPEVRSAMRRRQMSAARARMMADVPQADVVVTNPTHYAVALRYDPEKAAPVVVAKGKDIIAARIREIAREHDVPVVPDPPLARSLHAAVEVGQMIPEELYMAVARLLAFVYRVAARSPRRLTPSAA